MTGRVTGLWRYPIKAHGRESLTQVSLTPGQCLPWDRAWALARADSDVDGSQWVRCANFLQAARLPALQAITCQFDEARHQITLWHPDLPELCFDPDTNPEALVAWVAPLVPADSSRQPGRLVRAKTRGMTDTDFPSVTLCNMSSHRAVQDRIGHEISVHRWRGNIWIEGLAPWEEFDWVGREVQVGEAVFAVRERAVRCRATEANPDTGLRDVNTLQALSFWDHQEFSVYAEVVRAGAVRLDDKARRL